jgi:hypothetical protein
MRGSCVEYAGDEICVQSSGGEIGRKRLNKKTEA